MMGNVFSQGLMVLGSLSNQHSVHQSHKRKYRDWCWWPHTSNAARFILFYCQSLLCLCAGLSPWMRQPLFLCQFFSFSIGHGTLTTVTWIGLCLCSETLIKLISYTNWKWASVFESLQQRSRKDKAHSNIYSYLITKHMDMIPSYEDFKNTRECCVGVSDLRSIMFVSIVYSFHCSWHYSSISKLNGLGQNINAVRDTWVGDSREIVQ